MVIYSTVILIMSGSLDANSPCFIKIVSQWSYLRTTPHSVTQNPVLINGMLSAGAMILLSAVLSVPLIK
jgi:hypothetical protein